MFMLLIVFFLYFSYLFSTDLIENISSKIKNHHQIINIVSEYFSLSSTNRRKIVDLAYKSAEESNKYSCFRSVDLNVYPYFQLPMQSVAKLKPSSLDNYTSVIVGCLNLNSIHLTYKNDNILTLSLIVQSFSKSEFKISFFLVTNMNQVEITLEYKDFTYDQKTDLYSYIYNFELSKKAEDLSLEKWYIENVGLNLIVLKTTIDVQYASIFKTIDLFIENKSEDLKNFYEKYRGLLLEDAAPIKDQVPESYFNSGDLFVILREDFIDHLVAWATGSVSGHVTMLVRDPIDSSLWVYESTSKDKNWSVNGIQRTPYATWIELNQKHNYNVIHIPLRDKYASLINFQKIDSVFLELKGQDYGFSTFLWGWIDNVDHNWLCAPPYDGTRNYCIDKSIIIATAYLINHFDPAVPMEFIGVVISKIAGLNYESYKNIVELLKDTHIKGFSEDYIMQSPIKDKWDLKSCFNKNCKTKSFVCSSIACYYYKASGLFGEISDDIDCVEFANTDLYKINFFNSGPKLHPNCIRSSRGIYPFYCQISGKYIIPLTPQMVGRVAPYKNMNTKCKTEPPKYPYSPDC